MFFLRRRIWLFALVVCFFRPLAVYLVPSLLGDCLREYDVRRFSSASRVETDATTAIGSCGVGPRDVGSFSHSPGLLGYPLVGNTSICVTAAVFGSATAPLSLFATGRPSFLSPMLAAGSTRQPAARPDTATSAFTPERHSGQPVPFWAQQNSRPSLFRVCDVRYARNPTTTGTPTMVSLVTVELNN